MIYPRDDKQAKAPENIRSCTECPIRYRTRHFLNNFTINEDIATIRRTTDTFLFISHTTKLLLFKFRCNILIGVRIIKEMPGSVASGTPCVYFLTCNIIQHEQNLFTYKTMTFMVTECMLSTRCLFLYWTVLILNTFFSCHVYSAC